MASNKYYTTINGTEMRFTTPFLVKRRGTLTENGIDPLFGFLSGKETSDDPAAVSVWAVLQNLQKDSRPSFTGPLGFSMLLKDIQRPIPNGSSGVERFNGTFLEEEMYPSMPQNPVPMMQGANPAQQFNYPMPTMQQGIGGLYPQGVPMPPQLPMSNAPPVYMAQGGQPDPMYMAGGGQVAVPTGGAMRDEMLRRIGLMGLEGQMAQAPQSFMAAKGQQRPMRPMQQATPVSGKGQRPQAAMQQAVPAGLQALSRMRP
jgi:hypothetical protein